MKLLSQKKYSNKCILCKKTLNYYFTYRRYDYYKCTECLLVSTLPLPSQNEIENHYKKRLKSGNYDLLQKFSQEYKNVYKEFIRVLKKSLGKRSIKGLRVLDVGCFTGEFLELLQKEGADVYGLELQKDAVKIALKKMPGKIFNKDVIRDTLPKMKFDVITMLGLVEHVTDPVSLLEKTSKMLKPDGILLIQTPNSASLPAKIMKKYWPPFEPIEHIHIFSGKSLMKKLKKLGFVNIKKDRSVKKLSIIYVLCMLENFGPELYKLTSPFLYIFKALHVKVVLPFYIGEMIITAQKKSK